MIVQKKIEYNLLTLYPESFNADAVQTQSIHVHTIINQSKHPQSIVPYHYYHNNRL